ncbi:MAG: hypothetical protein QM723_22875 [Myxococcaceae bacterium]
MKRFAAAALLLAACHSCQHQGTPGDSVHEPVKPKRALDEKKVRAAIAHAAKWMAQFPPADLRFDAAIGLTAIRARQSDPALDESLKHAREVADKDGDNPLRPLFDADAGSTPSVWEVPDAGRVNVNRVLAEAVGCASNGIRPAVLDYASGPMRDQGGFQTTHALWALSLARDRGCLPRAEFNRRAGPLVAELRSAHSNVPGPTVQDLDLYAERALMLELAGVHDDQVTLWLEKLLDAQAKDGAWGPAGGNDPPYYRFHSTMAASWALAEALP